MRSTLIALFVMSVAANSVGADAGADFFERRIRPLFERHCLECHSTKQKKPKGGLDLGTRAGWEVGGESGPAVIPRKPGESLLLAAVRYDKRALKMPPRGRLAAQEIADLERWVAMGAPDPRVAVKATPAAAVAERSTHWAYRPAVLHPTPKVRQREWPHRELDRFILAALESKNLAPGPEAERAVLLRRLHFDLTGLPPPLERLDRFLADSSPDAVEREVDRLLASPHFGERWGRHWLDVARYADSSGGGRSLLFPDAWRYRDYVVDAFNRDLPFDRFVREQIAGDLLPASAPAERERQLVAIGFLALGPTNYERQDKDVLEADVIDEQLDTIGRAFLGQTIGCARCHDHKFDPIPTRDYYALAGILRSTQTLIHDNVSRWVDRPLPMAPELESAVTRHEASVAALKERIRVATGIEKKSGKPATAAALSASDLPGIVLDDTQAKKVGAWTPSKSVGGYVGDGYLHDGDSDKGQKTLTFIPDFPRAGRYEVRLSYTPGGNRAAKAPVTILHADGEQSFVVNQQEAPPVEGRFVSLGTFRFEKGNQGFVMVSNEGTTGHVIADALHLLPEGTKPVAASTVAVSKVKELEGQLKKLQDAAPARPVAMSVAEAKPGDFWVCVRGNIHNRGPTAPRGFLRIATAGESPVVPKDQSGRRELADWLASPTNPLTARVIVNRVWHSLFGAGLVRTVDVFGTTGEAPSHPELLDHLAIRFAERGWSIKSLIREIALSHTYRLAAGQPPTDDPENRMGSRANRRRLDAECLHDAMLAMSGRLDRRQGGPSMRPDTTSEIGYRFEGTRRSIYWPVFRNQLPEIFEAFDFPDPNLVSGRRNVSTIAPQALYLLNSPHVRLEAVHAARSARTRAGTDEEILDRAYRSILSRRPSERERDIALSFVRSLDDPPRAWERVVQALFASVDFRYVE